MNHYPELIKCLLLIALFVPAQVQSATVKGRVVNSRNSRPIQSATVLLVGTTLGSVTDSQGAFAINDVPPGHYVIRTSLIGAGQTEMSIAADSINQIIEVTILLKVSDQPLVPGCSSEFANYQSELTRYMAAHPAALSFEIGTFEAEDSSSPASVILTVMNDTPYDVYLLRDHGYCMQMYVQKLINVASTAVRSKTFLLHDKSVGGCLHDLTDVIRVPQHQTTLADTVKLWQYDIGHIPPGEYKLQLVYVFPQSRATSEELRYHVSSPIADEKGIGELYCMTLRGRFESNWLSIQIK